MNSVDTTILVNASRPLPLEWEPDDLVDLWKAQPRHYHLYPRQMKLVACAAEAANALFEQAERHIRGQRLDKRDGRLPHERYQKTDTVRDLPRRSKHDLYSRMPYNG